METWLYGTLAGSGSFRCEECGYVISLAASDTLPECPSCGGKSYARASLFTSSFDATQLQDEPPPPDESTRDWVAEVRSVIDEPGRYIAYQESDGLAIFPIGNKPLKIGRSLSADLRFDDPTVSRRHALVVTHDDDGIRVLDDRSLNGIFVNGKRVEWYTLQDGDEITIGRHHLRFIDASETPSTRLSHKRHTTDASTR